MELQLRDIELAAERLKPILHHTELDLSSTFSGMTGGRIYLKCENRQKTGSFKIRGASNKLAALTEGGRKDPVVASSAGNHAQGVAYAAKMFGVPATIVMPKAASIAKVQATQGYGAKVVLEGSCYDDAYAAAMRICQEEGATFLHPYNDADVIAGQGTLGLEILSDLPYVDAIVVPAGGGGLLAGVASAVKLINPRVQVFGVQAEGADAIAQSFQKKALVTTDSVSTIADGIAVKAPGDLTVELINRHADGVVTVSAVLNGKIDVEGKRVVCLLSGGNIDVSFIQSIIERGLVARHRRIKFIVTVVDQPGSLVRLLNVIAGAGGNILTVLHDKLSPRLHPNETAVHIACEVGGAEHGQAVLDSIRAQGYELQEE